mgnify:CR=1 FL=1
MKHRSSHSAAAALALSVCAAPAFSQSSGDSIQVYGFLAPMVDALSVKGASGTAPPAADRPSMLGPRSYNATGNGTLVRMQSSISNIGFRGSENLGAGWRANFQLETGIQVDDGSLTGGALAPSRVYNRNTRVGLSGPGGGLLLGSWDTPNAWSHLGYTNGVRNPYTGDSSDIFLTPGFNVPHSITSDSRSNSPADATFNRRQGNSIQYWSPNWAGFSFRLNYSLPEGDRTAANGARYAPSIYGLGAEYAAGPWTVRYVHQQQRNYFGLAWLGPNPAANPETAGSTATASKDINHRLIARYAIDSAWTVQGTVDYLDYRTSGVAAGSVNEYSRTAYSALLLYRKDLHVVWASYGLADDGHCSLAGSATCSTQDLGASMWSVGYRYNLSKRTDIFTSVYQVLNKANGQYGVFPRMLAGTAPGSRQSGLTLGLEHSF